VLAAVLGLSAQASAQFLDPSLSWQTLETPHFRITFHDNLEGTVQLTAQAAEEAWSYWKEKLGYAPTGKVEVVIVDYVDGPNGFALPFPNDEFVNFTAYAGFAGGFANSEAPSWEQTVTFHEYGHIADLGFVSGLSKTLRGVFGKLVLPGMGEPTLLIEGIPTYGEYKFRGASRANEPRVAMMLRAMVLDNAFPSYQQASFFYSRKAWPHPGSIAHDVGPWFLRYLEDTYGQDTFAGLKRTLANDPWWALGSMLQLNGDFNTVYKRVTGKTGAELWGEFKLWLEEQFGPQIQAIQAQGISASRKLSTLDYINGSPRWSPDGQWVYYGHADLGRARGLRRVHPDGLGDAALVSGPSAGVVSSDGTFMVYIKADSYRKFYVRNDLYRYDFDTGKETRLTWGERPLAFDLTPDGKSVIYARYNWGEQTPSLSRYDLVSGEVTPIQDFPADTAIENLALSPDGLTLALSIWRRGGYQDIYTLPVVGGELLALTQDKATDYQPTWSPSGDAILFSSDRSGVYNLYAYRLSDGVLLQVTNTLTGAFSPSVSPSEEQIAFTGYGSAGYDVRIMPYAPEQWNEVSFAQEDLPSWTGFPNSDYEVHPYDSAPSLLPKLWFPMVGDGQLGVGTLGQDALLQQFYNLSAGWDLNAARPFLNFGYYTSTMLPTLAASGSLSAEGYLFNAELGYPLVRSNAVTQQLAAGYSRHDFGTLSQSYSARWSLAAERGFDLFSDRFNLSVSATLNQKEGSENVQQVVTAWQERLSLPVLGGHSLSVRFAGGWSDAPDPKQGFALGGTQGRFGLRGFERGLQAGRLAAVGSVQYDYPLISIERGISLWPVFFDDVSGSLFVDAGVAGHELKLDEVRVGFGAELSLSIALSYFGGPTLSLGLAQGVGEPAPRVYLKAGLDL